MIFGSEEFGLISPSTRRRLEDEEAAHWFENQSSIDSMIQISVDLCQSKFFRCERRTAILATSSDV